MTNDEICDFIIPIMTKVKAGISFTPTEDECEKITQCFNGFYEANHCQSAVTLFSQMHVDPVLLRALYEHQPKHGLRIKQIVLHLGTKSSVEALAFLGVDVDKRVFPEAESKFLTALHGIPKKTGD